MGCFDFCYFVGCGLSNLLDGFNKRAKDNYQASIERDKAYGCSREEMRVIAFLTFCAGIVVTPPLMILFDRLMG